MEIQDSRYGLILNMLPLAPQENGQKTGQLR